MSLELPERRHTCGIIQALDLLPAGFDRNMRCLLRLASARPWEGPWWTLAGFDEWTTYGGALALDRWRWMSWNSHEWHLAHLILGCWTLRPVGGKQGAKKKAERKAVC